VLFTLGAPTVEHSEANGAFVTSRKAKFQSQPAAIVFLRTMVDEYRGVYAIRARARDIVFRQRGCRPKDQIGQAIALGQWVQDNITYVMEMPETFQTPTTTVAESYGDCDDFSTLIASMCESIGIPCELVGMEWGSQFGDLGILARLFDQSRYYRHIFPRAVVNVGGRVIRIPLDATLSAPLDGRQDPIRIALAQGVRGLRIFVA